MMPWSADMPISLPGPRREPDRRLPLKAFSFSFVRRRGRASVAAACAAAQGRHAAVVIIQP